MNTALNSIRWRSLLCFRGFICVRVFFVFLSFVVWNPFAWSLDDVVLYRFKEGVGENERYSYALLKEALEVTKKTHGDYQLSYNQTPMVRDRLRIEMLEGDLINVTVVSPTKEWEDVIRIPIPICRGLASYRLFLVNKNNRNLFSGVKNLSEIKQYTTGVDEHWATTKILERYGFSTVYVHSYQAMFNMLSKGRFDTFMRGANEVYDELDKINLKYPDLVLERNAAVFTYLPLYVYVSPQFPELAERLKSGLLQMYENGGFERIFEEFYGDDIKRAGLSNLNIFYLENVNVPAQWYKKDKKYLLDINLIGDEGL